MIKQKIKTIRSKYEVIVKNNNNYLLNKLYVFLVTAIRPVYFSKEFFLLNGLKKQNKYSNRKSIIFFTVHKSASTFIKNSIIEILGNDVLIPVNLSGYLSLKKHSLYYNNSKLMKKVLIKKGFFFGAFRSYYSFPELDRYDVLLVLRDPRDVLTSHYFSTLYNHPLGRKEVIDERKNFAGISIDDFVLKKAKDLAITYDDYCNNLLNRNNVLFLKYEDMIEDFDSWIKKLLKFFNLENKQIIADEISKKTSFKVDKENKHSFIRNIKPGDHLNKLKPETITSLNEIFAKSLKELNYL